MESIKHSPITGKAFTFEDTSRTIKDIKALANKLAADKALANLIAYNASRRDAINRTLARG